MTLEFEDHPFWDFSLRVYGSADVPAACLALQERRGIDVNVMLFCAWNGESGRGRLTDAELDSALAAVETWSREVVCALRAVRNRLKGGLAPVPRDRSDALRRRILKLEVDCEHAEQLALAGAVDRAAAPAPEAGRADDAAANVTAYFRRHGFVPDDADAAQTAIVLDAALPGIGRAGMEARCREAAV